MKTSYRYKMIIGSAVMVVSSLITMQVWADNIVAKVTLNGAPFTGITVTATGSPVLGNIPRPITYQQVTGSDGSVMFYNLMTSQSFGFIRMPSLPTFYTITPVPTNSITYSPASVSIPVWATNNTYAVNFQAVLPPPPPPPPDGGGICRPHMICY
jgi:hypothetical protein